MKPGITVLSMIMALFMGVTAFAQNASATWEVAAEQVAEETFRVTFSGTIAPGQHIYGIAPKVGNPFQVDYASAVTAGPLCEDLEPAEYDGEPVFFGKAVFSQEITAESGTRLEGSIQWQACTDDMCGFPEEQAFSVSLGTAPAQAHSSSRSDRPATRLAMCSPHHS